MSKSASKNRRVAIVGLSYVGATTAQTIADKELADVVLIDILKGVPQGEGLDVFKACPFGNSDCHVMGTNDHADTADSDIVVITAGLARKPGMSRDDLLLQTVGIVNSVMEQVVRHSPDCLTIPVTNPLDAMCQVVYSVSELARRCCRRRRSTASRPVLRTGEQKQ